MLNTCRAIPLKSTRGGGNFGDPQTKLGFCHPLRQKWVFSLYTPSEKTGFLPPSDIFFLVTPPDSFVQFYPPRTVFPANFTPSDSFFGQFIPIRQLFYPFYLDNFTPLRQFLRPPPATKMAISSPPPGYFLFEVSIHFMVIFMEKLDVNIGGHIV